MDHLVQQFPCKGISPVRCVENVIDTDLPRLLVFEDPGFRMLRVFFDGSANHAPRRYQGLDTPPAATFADLRILRIQNHVSDMAEQQILAPLYRIVQNDSGDRPVPASDDHHVLTALGFSHELLGKRLKTNLVVDVDGNPFAYAFPHQFFQRDVPAPYRIARRYDDRAGGVIRDSVGADGQPDDRPSIHALGVYQRVVRPDDVLEDGFDP